MRTILPINNLFLIFSLLQSSANPKSGTIDASMPPARVEEVETRPSLAAMSISLKAATGATIL